MTTGYIDWTAIENRELGNGEDGKKGDADSKFLKFKPGKYRVRLLGQPYFYDQSFIPKKLTGEEKDIPIISPGADDDPLIARGIKPTEKAAINVLNRKEGNKLQVMRVGASVFVPIINYAHEAGVNPADLKEGPDFSIIVEDPDGDPRRRKYVVTALKPTPLTKEEVQKIKADGGLFKLQELCKPTSIEKINELIEKYNIGEVDTSDTETGEEDKSPKTGKKTTQSAGKDESFETEESGEGIDEPAEDDESVAF